MRMRVYVGWTAVCCPARMSDRAAAPIKLRHAQYLLTNTNEPIKEIAFMLSFKSTEHFYTTFKRVTGYTPNAYRKFSTPSKG